MRPPIQRKRRTREHVIADLSVNHVERIVLRCGWVVQRLNPDYGIDLYMQTFTRSGEVQVGEVRFQLKATDSLQVLTRSKEIAFRAEWRDVLYWLNELMPVILIVYEAASDRAWWVHLQACLRESGQTTPYGASTTIHVPQDQILDETGRNSTKQRSASSRACVTACFERKGGGHEADACQVRTAAPTSG